MSANASMCLRIGNSIDAIDFINDNLAALVSNQCGTKKKFVFEREQFFLPAEMEKFNKAQAKNLAAAQKLVDAYASSSEDEGELDEKHILGTYHL